jgi:hypothetical protein
MRKAALIIASQEFRRRRILHHQGVLEKNNITVKTVCTKLKPSADSAEKLRPIF